MIRVLYLGSSRAGSTSAHRADALRRIGCTVNVRDPYISLGRALQSSVASRVHYHTGYRLLQKRMMEWCRVNIRDEGAADLIWVDSGELMGASCISVLREGGVPVVLFNHDDATGTRDGPRFDSLRAAIHLYDLCAVCRDVNVGEYRALGARDVAQFTRGYDEVEHAPHPNAEHIGPDFRSQVAFIGTWMRNENRDSFLLHLLDLGVPVAIWGDRWEKSKHWRHLRDYHRGGGLSGRDYVAAIQGAEICLGMVSKGNRDESTTRSAEIPFAGGLLCAERTREHQKLYCEGEEAVFWSDSTECAEQCARLLKDDGQREAIRASGRRRVIALRIGNESICKGILERALK